MTTKICNTCNQTKDLSEFGRQNAKNNFHKGLIPVYKGDCKKCLAKKAKAYRDSKPDLWKKYKDKSKSKNAFFPDEHKLLVSAIRTRIHSAKQNNKRYSDREFALTDEYMYTLWKSQQGKCALSGVDLVIEKSHPDSLSIDKIIPEKGYTEGNVQWVTISVNRAKSDLTQEQLITMCQNILKTCND